jgi:hypothetical protein
MARDSGQRSGKRFIRGGRPHLRQAFYMPALVAVRFNAALKAKYDALLAAGKPPKMALTAIMRKLRILANALLRDGRPGPQYVLDHHGYSSLNAAEELCRVQSPDAPTPCEKFWLPL